MRIAYLDCFAGIAGDMMLGALVDAGVPLEVLERATESLGLGAKLRVTKVDRSGISSTKVDVMVGEQIADRIAPPLQQQQREIVALMRQPETQHQHKAGDAHSHEHDPAHSHEHDPAHSHEHDPTHSHEHDPTHPAEAAPAREEHTHEHEHSHSHNHGRSLTVIRGLIKVAALEAPVKQMAIRAFELLGHSEAKIHDVPVDEIHFHEVGAVDAIVDIVAACAGIHHLNVGAWYCSAINVGSGTVVCAHGTFPVPAPATADLLRGLPTYAAHVEQELVTPTGAALLRAINPVFGLQPAMRVEQIGYGAGTRTTKDFPNVVRLCVGEALEAAAAGPTAMVPSAATANEWMIPSSSNQSHRSDGLHQDTVTVIETALDDLSPQVLAFVAEQALAIGALDVMLTPVIMKKGRPGTLLTVLCKPTESAALERLILSETSTLGVRIRQDRRRCLERRYTTVSTPYGEVRMKVGTLAGETLNVAPEFEDCRRAAQRHGVALKQVQQAAVASYWTAKAGEDGA